MARNVTGDRGPTGDNPTGDNPTRDNASASGGATPDDPRAPTGKTAAAGVAVAEGPTREIDLTPPAARTAGEEAKSFKDFTDAIYQSIEATFASKNPTQLLCVCWPGTVLDYRSLSWTRDEETAGRMPVRALARSSLVLDQYVPPAPITQPDGTRLSDRYAQAISQLGPRPNADLIKLQQIIRDRLEVDVTRVVDGKERTSRSPAGSTSSSANGPKPNANGARSSSR